MLFRPVIGHNMWASSITEEQKIRIQVERLKQIEEAKGETITEATDYEALVYLMTVSLSQPLDSMWYRHYMRLFKRFYPDKSDFIEDNETRIQPHEEWELTRLKRWLYHTSTKKR